MPPAACTALNDAPSEGSTAAAAKCARRAVQEAGRALQQQQRRGEQAPHAPPRSAAFQHSCTQELSFPSAPGYFVWAELHNRRLRLWGEAGGQRLPHLLVGPSLLSRRLTLPLQRLSKLGGAACAPLLGLLLLRLLLRLLRLAGVHRVPILLCLLSPVLLLFVASAGRCINVAAVLAATTLLPTLHACRIPNQLLLSRLLQKLRAGCAAAAAVVAIGIHHMQARVLQHARAGPKGAQAGWWQCGLR